MDHIRSYITLSLALILMLSGMANGYARAMTLGAHSIEICSELGNENVTLGLNGEKLPAIHDCTSCCLAVGLLQADMPYAARRGLANLAAWRSHEHALTAGDAHFSTWPRGPPIKA